MELQNAIEIVRNLAKGIDPKSGAFFEKDSPYNNPDVIRALFTLLEHLPKRKKSPEERQQENIEKGLPRNTGMPWTEEARAEVAQSYKTGTSIENIAETQARSRIAIIAELRRQEIITLEEATRLGLVIRPVHGTSAARVS